MARRVLGIAYSEKELEEYYRVEKLAKEHNQTMSSTGKQLVNRGLQHLNNPHPLFGDAEAGSSVKAIRKERKQGVSAVNNSAVKHLSGEQSQQRSSGDKLTPGNEADRSRGFTPASDKKKSPQKDNSWLGWVALLGLGSFLFGPRIYTWLTK